MPYRSENPYTEKMFKQHFKSEIKTIVEIGCNNYEYTYKILEEYNPDVIYAFDIHPEVCRYCKENTRDTRIIFTPKAVSNRVGKISFYPYRGISGCSSVFKRIDPENQENPIEVDCIRLDNFFAEKNVTKIDLLCMDIQGSEIMAMQGLGDLLQNVSYIIMEMPNGGPNSHIGAPKEHDCYEFFKKNSFSVIEKIYENDSENNVLIKNDRIS